ncbi:MAG: hypothetical protein PWR16_781 [Methanoculleus sp.]|nr:hypothetical protein [Methanoculleus sp.]
MRTDSPAAARRRRPEPALRRKSGETGRFRVLEDSGLRTRRKSHLAALELRSRQSQLENASRFLLLRPLARLAPVANEKNDISGDAGDIGVRRYGTAIPGGRGQTPLNTSSSGYMNPLPRGEKVNGPGASPVPRDPLIPPTYKGPTQAAVGARSAPAATIPIRRGAIPAQNRDMEVPDLEQSCGRAPQAQRGAAHRDLQGKSRERPCYRSHQIDNRATSPGNRRPNPICRNPNRPGPVPRFEKTS